MKFLADDAGRLAVKWLATWRQCRGEQRRGEQRCSLCAGFESAIWELQQRDYPTTTTREEYRVHRLQKHPVSPEHAGPQRLTYTRVVVDNDAA
jgi:hypothetical protein